MPLNQGCALVKGKAQRGRSKKMKTNLDMCCPINRATWCEERTASTHGLRPLCLKVGAEPLFGLTQQLLYEFDALMRDTRSRRKTEGLLPVEDLLSCDVSLKKKI